MIQQATFKMCRYHRTILLPPPPQLLLLCIHLHLTIAQLQQLLWFCVKGFFIFGYFRQHMNHRLGEEEGEGHEHAKHNLQKAHQHYTH